MKVPLRSVSRDRSQRRQKCWILMVGMGLKIPQRHKRFSCQEKPAGTGDGEQENMHRMTAIGDYRVFSPHHGALATERFGKLSKCKHATLSLSLCMCKLTHTMWEIMHFLFA